MLDVYFDYRSPFVALISEPVAALERRFGIEACWIPIRLPELSSYAERPMGHNFPKRNNYIGTDLRRWSKRRNVKIQPPESLLNSPSPPGTTHDGKGSSSKHGAATAFGRSIEWNTAIQSLQ